VKEDFEIISICKKYSTTLRLNFICGQLAKKMDRSTESIRCRIKRHLSKLDNTGYDILKKAYFDCPEKHIYFKHDESKQGTIEIAEILNTDEMTMRKVKRGADASAEKFKKRRNQDIGIFKFFPIRPTISPIRPTKMSIKKSLYTPSVRKSINLMEKSVTAPEESPLPSLPTRAEGLMDQSLLGKRSHDEALLQKEAFFNFDRDSDAEPDTGLLDPKNLEDIGTNFKTMNESNKVFVVSNEKGPAKMLGSGNINNYIWINKGFLDSSKKLNIEHSEKDSNRIQIKPKAFSQTPNPNFFNESALERPADRYKKLEFFKFQAKHTVDKTFVFSSTQYQEEQAKVIFKVNRDRSQKSPCHFTGNSLNASFSHIREQSLKSFSILNEKPKQSVSRDSDEFFSAQSDKMLSPKGKEPF
jgi:hypothetical protein